jgi:hypothetical protein
VDPSVASLNQFSENVSKAEALSSEIADILRGAAQNSEPAIEKDEGSFSVARSSPGKSRVSGGVSSLKRSGGHFERQLRQRQTSTEPPAKPKPANPSQPALPVSPGLFYRYDRHEIYEKVWKTPMQEVAKEYGLTDFTLRKTCERLWIPAPRRGYWARRAANEPVAPAPPLPAVRVLRRKKQVTRSKS